MASTAEELRHFAQWPPLAAELARKFWPGPLTLIVGARPAAALLGGKGTVGVRIPADPLALALLRLTGPLATTSANRHGQEPLPDARSALSRLSGLQGALSDDGSSPKDGAPSSILDLTREGPVLIREGGLSARQLGVSVTGQDPRIRRD
jgi:L-threonylcarbamoyladenylate synthase